MYDYFTCHVDLAGLDTRTYVRRYDEAGVHLDSTLLTLNYEGDGGIVYGDRGNGPRFYILEYHYDNNPGLSGYYLEVRNAANPAASTLPPMRAATVSGPPPVWIV